MAINCLYFRRWFPLLITLVVGLQARGLGAQEAVEAQVVPLWKNGAPGFESRKSEPEQSKDYWVKNIHNPTLTVFQAGDNANGTGVVIVPGGGHRILVIDAEGTEMAKKFQAQGVTAFVLKHRLAREPDSPYQIEVHAKQDGQRAMRWVRHHAADYGIEKDRIGMMGFSAGGEVVSMVTYGSTLPLDNASDEVDRQSCGPNFQILIYPGPLGIPDSIGKRLPPSFLLVAADDGATKNIVNVMNLYRDQKASYEIHVYAEGGHAFNLGQRSELKSIQTWTDRLFDWMIDRGWIDN